MGSYDADALYGAFVTTAMKDRLTRLQEERLMLLEEYASLLLRFNRVHNLISRKDTEDVFEHHIVHCLAVSARPFPAGAVIVDWGSGGGLPAIPIAIVNPDVRLVAVDAVEKKMMAVDSMARRLGLTNIATHAGRAEAFEGAAQYSVSRATAPLAALWGWHKRVVQATDSKSSVHASVSGDPSPSSRPSIPPGAWEPGLIALKGGNLEEEIGQLLEAKVGVCIDLYDVATLTEDRYFEGKRLIHVYT